MKLFLLALVIFLASTLVQGIKKCVKIDACRCSTDEGEINLWSLAGEDENDRPRFNIPEAPGPDVPGQTNDSYQWNPCVSWTAKRLPNETRENSCKDVAVCKIQKTPFLGTYHVNIGQQNLSNCALKNGQCQLTYGVTADKQIKTSITLVCDESEEGRVEAMSSFTSLYSTTLHAKCACPGKCVGLSTGAIVGIVIGSTAAFLFLAFAVFICCLRYKLPSGVPKPSMCTTIKVGFGLIITTCCPCCKRLEYSTIPGSSSGTEPTNTKM